MFRWLQTQLQEGRVPQRKRTFSRQMDDPSWWSVMMMDDQSCPNDSTSVFRWLQSVMGGPHYSPDKRSYITKMINLGEKAADLEQCILLRLARQMFLERAIVYNSLKDTWSLEPIKDSLSRTCAKSMRSLKVAKWWWKMLTKLQHRFRFSLEINDEIVELHFLRANFPVCQPCLTVASFSGT